MGNETDKPAPQPKEPGRVPVATVSNNVTLMMTGYTRALYEEGWTTGEDGKLQPPKKTE